ncbi:MAG: hypothetical protein KME31_37255 [Tolypothrix carrinoi HA7290-LM1]|jgi:uncharacterized phage-associated protein|nr:hypothetical protein [Tolypothrix carrinoi HA7290-LM1]
MIKDFNDLNDFPVAKAQLIIQLFNSIKQNLQQIGRLNETEKNRLFEQLKSKDKKWLEIINRNNIDNMEKLVYFVWEQYRSLENVQLIQK